MTSSEVQGLLADKVVVVSGVGPGLGAALAREAAVLGADVVLASRSKDRLERVAEDVRERGRRAVVVPIDITDDADRRDLLDTVLVELGRVDCLVHNAFGIPPMEPITSLAGRKGGLDSLRLAAETNVHAPLQLTALFADALAERKGSVVMVNSAVLHQSQPEFAGYKLSKGALAHLASSLASELGPRGIRVNSIAPSYIYEDVNKAYFDWLASESGRSHEDVYAEKAAPTDLRRLATADEVARAALFLASDLASAVTGQMLNVDCGEFHTHGG